MLNARIESYSECFQSLSFRVKMSPLIEEAPYSVDAGGFNPFEMQIEWFADLALAPGTIRQLIPNSPSSPSYVQASFQES